MKITFLKKLLFIFLLLILQQYGYSQVIFVEEDKKSPEGKSFYLTANTALSDDQNTLKEIVNDAKTKNNSSLVLLGNIVSKNGYNGAQTKTLLNNQLKIIEQFNGDIIITPGNNEWKIDGPKGVEKIEKYIEKNKIAKFYPNNGNPIKKVSASADIDLIIIDSQWYLENWDKYPNINESNEINDRGIFYFELLSLLKKSEGKTKIVIIHHPIISNTSEGFLHKTGGISIQDVRNKQYQNMRSRIATIARQVEDVIFVSGHDNNMQLIDYFGIPQIISGSGSTNSNKKVKTKNKEDFGVSKKGYARLDIDKNGTATINFFEVNNATSKLLYTKIVNEKNEDNLNTLSNYSNSFKNIETSSVYSLDETTKSGLYKFIWGDHYRKYFGTPIQAQTVVLDTFLGGLTPVRRGGGQQSNALRLEDKNGKQYVMRAIRKNSIKFIQNASFQDKFVTERLSETSIDRMMLDFFTTAHPYTPLAVGELSQAVDIFHANPKVYYVPKQKTLGVFNDTFGDELYLIEERVASNQKELESFGKPEDIISTDDVIKEIFKNGKSHVDEPSYIRARIFDMLIGDWDRHADQWRWALFTNSDDTKSFKPIPRDRDQAFSKFSGNFLSFLKFSTPTLRVFQSYDDDLNHINWFNSAGYHLDLFFVHTSGWDEWEKQATYIQNNLTDEVIDQAFNNIPDEIKGETIDGIKSKLRGRRTNIVKITKEYFGYLNETQIIVGTQKNDIFNIERMSNGKTKISFVRKDTDIFERVFTKDLTKEIWIYGLDGKDSFNVYGDGNDLIKIKTMGGKKNDIYDFKNTNKVKLFDYKSKNNTIVNKKSNKSLADSYEANTYNFKKKKYNTNQFMPTIGANPDDGFKIGFVDTFTKYGLQRNPFTSQHMVGANYYFGNSGFDVFYTGEFSNIIHKWNFGIEGLYESPKFAMNYFGLGNETEYDRDLVDLDYNRVRIRKWKTAIALIWRGRDGGYFHFKPLFESLKVENTKDRYITEEFPPDSNVFENQNYAGVEINYKFQNYNSTSFPTLALDLGITTGYKAGVSEFSDENSFAYLETYFGFIYNLIPSNKLALATRIGGEAILGDHFEFYHGATLGGNHELRGYRNERFNGNYSFYQNIELRYRLGKSRESFLPIKYGLTTGFDYGRVWVENHDSNKWHNNYGGSFWISGFEYFTTNIGYYYGAEKGRITFSLGFEF